MSLKTLTFVSFDASNLQPGSCEGHDAYVHVPLDSNRFDGAHGRKHGHAGWLDVRSSTTNDWAVRMLCM